MASDSSMVVGRAGTISTSWMATCRPACLDRKSTRLNSSHLGISYSVFFLKKKELRHRHWNPLPDKPATLELWVLVPSGLEGWGVSGRTAAAGGLRFFPWSRVFFSKQPDPPPTNPLPL